MSAPVREQGAHTAALCDAFGLPVCADSEQTERRGSAPFHCLVNQIKAHKFIDDTHRWGLGWERVSQYNGQEGSALFLINMLAIHQLV